MRRRKTDEVAGSPKEKPVRPPQPASAAQSSATTTNAEGDEDDEFFEMEIEKEFEEIDDSELSSSLRSDGIPASIKATDHSTTTLSSTSPVVDTHDVHTISEERHEGGFLDVISEIIQELRNPGDVEKTTEKPLVKSEAPLHPKLLQRNMKRFYNSLDPYTNVLKNIRSVQKWDNPYKSTLAMLSYFYLAWHGSITIGILWLLMGWYARSFLRAHGYLQVEHVEEKDSKSDETSLRDKVKLAMMVARLVQNYTGAASNVLEKIHNLLTWQVPSNSMQVVYVLMTLLLLFMLVPYDLCILAIQVALGVKFFILDAVYIHRPRLKAKYDSTARFFAQLPRDVDLPTTEGSISSKMEHSIPTPVDDEKSAPVAVDKKGLVSPVKASPKSTRKARTEHEAIYDNIGIPKNEEIVSWWNCLDVSKGSVFSSKRGKLYLTSGHVVFLRGDGAESSGSYFFKLKNIQELRRGKPGSYVGKGFTLEFTVSQAPDPPVTYTYGALINRDEAYVLVCQTAKLPCDFTSS